MSKSSENKIDEMMEKVMERMVSSTPGEQAIIGMLGIIAHLLGEIGENQERLTKQFNEVSAGGTAILMERS